MAAFAGLVQLGSTLDVVVIAKNTSNVPTDADTFPTYRIYGPAGFLAAGSLSFKDTNVITNAPPASPTVYTCNGHNLSVGQLVTVTGVGGNTAANASAAVTAVTTNTFTTATDSHSSGAYTSGGTFHANGVYDFNYTPTIANNFASGTAYSVFVIGLFSTVSQSVDNFTFQVT